MNLKSLLIVVFLSITLSFSQDIDPDLQDQIDDLEREWKTVKTCAIIGCIGTGVFLVTAIILATQISKNKYNLYEAAVEIEEAAVEREKRVFKVLIDHHLLLLDQTQSNREIEREIKRIYKIESDIKILKENIR